LDNSQFFFNDVEAAQVTPHYSFLSSPPSFRAEGTRTRHWLYFAQLFPMDTQVKQSHHPRDV